MTTAIYKNTSAATSDTMYPTRKSSGCRVDVDLIQDRRLSTITKEVLLHLELKAGQSRVAYCRAADIAKSIGCAKYSINRAITTLQSYEYVTKADINQFELRQLIDGPEARYCWMYPNWFLSRTLKPAEKHIYLHILATGYIKYRHYKISIEDILDNCKMPRKSESERRKYVHKTIEKLYALELLTRRSRDQSRYHAAIYTIDEYYTSKVTITEPPTPNHKSDRVIKPQTELPETHTATNARDETATNARDDNTNALGEPPQTHRTLLNYLNNQVKSNKSPSSTQVTTTIRGELTMQEDDSEVEDWEIQAYSLIEPGTKYHSLLELVNVPGNNEAEQKLNLKKAIIKVRKSMAASCQ